MESFEPMVRKLGSGHEMFYKMVELRFCAMHFESLPEACIPSLESFGPMIAMLRTGQEMLYTINQRGIIKKRNRVELRYLCTALRVIARYMHTKIGVIWTYDDKVTRTPPSKVIPICRLFRRHKKEFV